VPSSGPCLTRTLATQPSSALPASTLLMLVGRLPS